MKVNLAAGDVPIDGAINIDLRGGDVVADVTRLPFPDASVDELEANDILEHFWRDDAPALLAEWRRVAKRDGRLTVRVPNLEWIAVQLIEKPHHTERLVTFIYGGHKWGAGGCLDTHHWGYTAESLSRMLRDSGWTPVSLRRAENITATAVAA